MKIKMEELKPDTRMFLDAYAGGAMKIKTIGEVRELIDNTYLNEYWGHSEVKVRKTTRRGGWIVFLETSSFTF